MMRFLCNTFLVLGATGLLVSALRAQQPPGGTAILLSNKDVQKELKLSDEQTAKASKVAQAIAQKHQEELFKFLNPVAMLSGEGDMKKQLELSRKLTDEVVEGMGDTLKPEQVQRYKQLALQQAVELAGAGVFLDPELSKALKLTDKQKEDLKGIADDLPKKRQGLFKDAKGGFAEVFKKVATLNKESVDEAVRSLTDDQKKTWKEMVGQPFDLKTSPLPSPSPGKGTDKG
jgi:hypothetical protein